MSRKIRKSLQKKIDKALAIAATKEGREVTDTVIPNDTQLNIVLAGYDYKLLADGRYVYREWDEDRKCWITHMVDNAPVNVLEVLFELSHDEMPQERYKNENEDPAYQMYLKRVSRGAADIGNPMDRSAVCLNYYGNPEDIVIRKLCGVKEKVVPEIDRGTVRITTTSSGTRFDAETMLMMKAALHEHIKGLSPEQRRTFEELFGTNLPQKDLAQMRGVSEAAISKRKAKFIASAKEMFLRLGYPVIDKSEAKRESHRRKKYEDHYEAVSREIAEIYFGGEDDAAETA